LKAPAASTTREADDGEEKEKGTGGGKGKGQEKIVGKHSQRWEGKGGRLWKRAKKKKHTKEEVLKRRTPTANGKREQCPVRGGGTPRSRGKKREKKQEKEKIEMPGNW